MKKLWVLAAVLAAVALVAVWFVDRGGIFPTKEIRYRFEVTVDTPAGTMTSYSVHRLVIQDTTMTPARNYQIELDGEAVPFPLQDGRILFATLQTVSGAGPQQVVGATVKLSGTGRWIDAPNTFERVASSEYFPLLAIIDDPTNSSTLMPLSSDSEFKVTQLRLISTDEKMTEEVARLLPWLVDAIWNLPTISTRITDQHVLISSLKVGVRS